MDLSLQPQLDLENVGPEVKSYIYQVLTEFEPFVTPETVVSVVAKDPEEARLDEDLFNEAPPLEKPRYRICIRLAENGTQIESEGLGMDIFSALKSAKDSLLKTLIEIQDRVVDASERSQQIRSALNAPNIH